MAGFFGSSLLKRRNMFDPSGDLGPIDPGMSMPDYAGEAAASLPDESAAPAPKPSFFGAGGVGRGIAGSIGDFLLQMNHMQPIYAPAMEHQRNLQDMQASKGQDRKAEMAQWVAQQQWKKDHPEPVSNDTEHDYQLIAQTLGPDAAKDFLDSKAHPQQWTTIDNGDGTKTIVPVPRGGMGGMGSPGTPHPPQQPGGALTAASLLPGLIQRESGGVPGRLGPQTKYGQPQGLTQMLPRTAQEMAGKLGVPWQPDMMTGTSPEAAAYQSKLGQAYLQQGFDANGGDPRAALMYYHGGPNKGLWGPKTRAYADAILGAQGGAQPGPQSGSPPRISSPMELAQLQSGTLYIAPDGSVKRKR